MRNRARNGQTAFDGSLSWLGLRGPFSMRSYQLTFRKKDVAVRTPTLIQKHGQLRRTKYIGMVTKLSCQTMPTATLVQSRAQFRFAWKSGSSSRTKSRILPQKPQGLTVL